MPFSDKGTSTQPVKRLSLFHCDSPWRIIINLAIEKTSLEKRIAEVLFIENCKHAMSLSAIIIFTNSFTIFVLSSPIFSNILIKMLSKIVKKMTKNGKIFIKKHY